MITFSFDSHAQVLVGNKAYTGIIADLFPSLPDVLPWYLSRTALITWITLAIAPLLAASTLHGMAAISAISVTASSLSMLCLLGMALGAILQGTVPPIRWLPDLTFFGTRPSIIAIHTLAILPVVMTAFICHMSIHPLAQDLEGYTPRRMRMVVAMSLGACCTMYAGTGAAGYSTFGEDVAGDVLANVQPETVAELFNCSDAAGVAFVATLKSCVAVAMLTSVPLSLWPARADILELMTKVLGGQPSKTAFYIVTYASLAAIYVGAVAVESSYSMVALIGATCGIALAFVFPGMISMRLAAVEEVDDRTARRQYVNGVMLLIIGGILTAAGVTSTIIARGRE